MIDQKMILFTELQQKHQVLKFPTLNVVDYLHAVLQANTTFYNSDCCDSDSFTEVH